MSDLVETLAERGFREVDGAGLPGGWATDGDVTVCIQSRQGRTLGDIEHEVVVYDHEPGLIAIDSQPAARTLDTSHGRAIRRALAEAGVEGGDP